MHRIKVEKSNFYLIFFELQTKLFEYHEYKRAVENASFYCFSRSWIILFFNEVIMNFQNLSIHFCNSNENWKFILFDSYKKTKGKFAFSTFILGIWYTIEDPSRLNYLYFVILKHVEMFQYIPDPQVARYRSKYLSYQTFVLFPTILNK